MHGDCVGRYDSVGIRVSKCQSGVTSVLGIGVMGGIEWMHGKL